MVSLALDRERAAVGLDPVGQSAQPRAARWCGAADPVVGDEMASVPFARSALKRDLPRLRMLHGVGQPLARDEVGRGLELMREALAVRPDLDRQRGAGGELPERRREPGVELRRPDSAGELLELADSDGDLRNRAVDRLRRAVSARAQLVLRVAQREPDRDQPLLGSVVQVALEPPPLLIAGGRRFARARPRPRRAGGAAPRAAVRSRSRGRRPRRPPRAIPAAPRRLGL